MQTMLFKKNFVPSETQREAITSAEKWASGLIDGDGHIGMQWTDRAKTKWVPLLKVSLHVYNARAIYKLKKILRCGKITTHKNLITLRVRSAAHWRHLLLPMWRWRGFPLRSYKYYDVLCVQHALAISQDPNLPHRHKQNLFATLKQQLKQNKLSDCISPVWMTDARVLDLDWLAGFVEAEGSFYILKNGQHGFALGQASDRHIIAAVHQFYDVKAALKKRPNYLMLDTKNKTTLLVIANTMKNRMLGIKNFEFTLWLRTLIKGKRCKSLKARQIIHAMKVSGFQQRFSPSPNNVKSCQIKRLP